MVSPAKAHFLRVSAAALAVAPAVSPNASQYELMLAKLAEDRRRLKDVQSIERKAEVKRQLLPEYAPWIEGVLAGNSGVQDDVLMTIMVWRIDIGDIAGALPLAKYAIAHKLVLPDQYQRTTACLIAEETADMALKGAITDIEALQQVLDLTADEDMPDEVRAKLYKAIGYALRDGAMGNDAGSQEQLTQARDHLQRALSLHDKVGVKKDIERLETAIKNSAPAPAPSGGKG
ncbi:MAG TPA: terminase endonuclease subunit [Rhodocyclaceae bacterium]|nr:terminase endonuclease subunit [Rhodocyclaceae bacterium]